MSMNDGLIVLGAIAIVGLVAVASIALVYDRGLFVRGSKSEMELRTGDRTIEKVAEQKSD